MKTVSLNEIMQLLDGELTWCREHDKEYDSQLSREYRDGFVKGIVHAKSLILQLTEIDNETWENTILSDWVDPEE